MIGLLEKVLAALAGLALLTVGAGAAAHWLCPGCLRSGFPRALAGSVIATQGWLDAQRARHGAPGLPGERGYEPRLRVHAGGATSTSPPAAGDRSEPQPDPPDDGGSYFAGDLPIPPGDQVPGIPWLRVRPGLRYQPPRKVPGVLHDKYRSFEDAWELAQEGGGAFVETDLGAGYRVDWLEERSLLSTLIGLRPGDTILSINGLPVGRGVSAAQALFERLRGTTRFAVLIERRGRRIVLSFVVDR